MSSFYSKGKGRKSALERSQIASINDLIEQHDIDMSKYDVATTPQELTDLRNKLFEEYGAPDIKKDKFPLEKEEQPTEQPEPVETEEPTKFEEPERVETPEAESSPSRRTFELSEFEPVKTTSPFEEQFPAQDMHKAVSDFPVIETEEVSQPEPVQTDSTPNSWELLKNKTEKVSALDRIDNDEPATQSESPVTKADESKKVPMSSEARRKANESFARQTSKIFTWLSESGVKYFSKVKDKHITELEEDGLIDRNYIVGGKSVAELLEEHHELIDEMVKVDPQSKNDLIEAIKLVSEEYDIQMSPLGNLGMVVVTILLTMGQVGLQSKREFKKHLKKVSDQYVMQKRQIAPMQDRIRELEGQLDAQQNGAPASSFTQPVEMSPEPAQIKELSFSKKDSTGLKISRSEVKEIEEDIAQIQTLDSDIEEGTITIKKNGKKAVKRGKRPTGTKK